MALARSRQAARRVKDRWKAKQWYQVQAPAAFNNLVLAETLADDPTKLKKRRVEVPMNEFTGDMKQMHVKLYFQVSDVHDATAATQYVGHTMTSDYVRRLTRRGHTKIPAVFDLRCKDGARIRVKPFAIADRRCQTTQAQQVRRVMHDLLEEAARTHTLNGFLHEILLGDITTRMYKDARKIHPIRRIEVAKSEILKAPAVEEDETPVIVLKEPEPEPEETEAEASDDTEAEGDAAAVAAVAADSEEE